MSQKKNNSGQALLLVLLSVGVIITVGLSAISRSITDLSTTTRSEQSLRAFSAAEAGVEDTLKSQVSALPTNAPVFTNTQVGTNSTYTANSRGIPEIPSQYAYPVELLSGDIGTFWFATHATNNSLTCAAGVPCYRGTSMDLCWGKVGVGLSEQPAIAMGVIYEESSALRYGIVTYDPVAARRSQNRFGSGNPPSGSPAITTDVTNGACTIDQTKYANRAQLDFTGIGISNAVSTGGSLKGAIFRVFYNANPTIVGMLARGGATLPLQGRKIESTGASGDATRKVQVYALYPEVPNIFHAVIYSPPGIIKTP